MEPLGTPLVTLGPLRRLAHSGHEDWNRSGITAEVATWESPVVPASGSLLSLPQPAVYKPAVVGKKERVSSARRGLSEECRRVRQPPKEVQHGTRHKAATGRSWKPRSHWSLHQLLWAVQACLQVHQGFGFDASLSPVQKSRSSSPKVRHDAIRLFGGTSGPRAPLTAWATSARPTGRL